MDNEWSEFKRIDDEAQFIKMTWDQHFDEIRREMKALKKDRRMINSKFYNLKHVTLFDKLKLLRKIKKGNVHLSEVITRIKSKSSGGNETWFLSTKEIKKAYESF